jgi:hypothetical protein
MTSSRLLRAPSFHRLHAQTTALARGLPFVTFLLAPALTLASVQARAEQSVITPVSYATTIDLIAGTANFAVRFDRAPDFQAVNSFGTLLDDFQIWTDTVSLDPITSTFDGIYGRGPLGTQMMVTTRFLPERNQLSLLWPTLLTDPGPRDPGGWGSVKAYANYQLAADHTLSFDVPLALLRATDGAFHYGFETYQSGAWGGVDYFGDSGQSYVMCVPEPAHAVMLGVGAGLLLLAAGRRRRQCLHTGAAPMQAC